MNLNTQLFAVTDQHIVLELRLSSVNQIDCQYSIGATELIDNESAHAISHHKHYFSEITLFEGNAQKESLFTCKEAARQYAQKNIAAEIISVSKKLERLHTIEKKLAA